VVGFEVEGVESGVDLRSLESHVPEHARDVLHRCAVLDEVGGEPVTQAVRGDAFFEHSALAQTTERRVDRVEMHPLAALIPGHEKRPGGAMLTKLGADVVEVVEKVGKRLGADRYHALPPALAPHA